MTREITVVHLVWRPLEIAMLGQFVAAYQRNRGGVDHNLLILYNGFSAQNEISAFENVLTGITHSSIVLPNPIQDIPAYFVAGKVVTTDRLCFVNSYSRPLDPLWLQKLSRYLDEPGVGVVGATGSWESHLSGLLTGTLFERKSPSICRLVRTARRWNLIRQAGAKFAPFPNAHLRTNSFMIERTLWNSLTFPSGTGKEPCLEFESGKSGMTAQLAERQLRPVVVGKDGMGYEAHRWLESRTYRQDQQQNLLVADNRTDQYFKAESAGAEYLRRLAWNQTRMESVP